MQDTHVRINNITLFSIRTAVPKRRYVGTKKYQNGKQTPHLIGTFKLYPDLVQVVKRFIGSVVPFMLPLLRESG
jgi:hypothetical protein